MKKQRNKILRIKPVEAKKQLFLLMSMMPDVTEFAG
jgi:hypothetical protein